MHILNIIVIFFFRKTVVHGGAVIPHPFGISLFEHSVYFTDWTKMAVMKANKFTDTNPQVVYTTSQTPHGVAVIHKFKQPQGMSDNQTYQDYTVYCKSIRIISHKTAVLMSWLGRYYHVLFVTLLVQNPCGTNRGDCEQICVLSHQSDNGGLGYRCKCRMGYDLHADGKRCFGKRLRFISVFQMFKLKEMWKSSSYSFFSSLFCYHKLYVVWMDIFRITGCLISYFCLYFYL